MPKSLSDRALVRTRRPEFPVYCLRHHAVDAASRWSQEHFPCQQNRSRICVLYISAAPTPLDNVLHDGYRFIFQFSAILIMAGIFESSGQIKPC